MVGNMCVVIATLNHSAIGFIKTVAMKTMLATLPAAA
jgi:hypothetical protein